MKKLLTIITVAATLASVSAFGQGYFLFTAGTSTVYNGVLGTRGGAYDVAFLFGSGTPLVDSIMASTPTSGAPTINAQTAWSDILSDPSYTLAIDSNLSAPAVAAVSAPGGFSYNGGSTFPVQGTASGGGSTTVYVIAWDNTYATPAAAQTAGAAVGWSAPFAYAYGSSIGTPVNFTSSGIVRFGVAPVPEPATMALAGLGGLALLAFRRRK